MNEPLECRLEEHRITSEPFFLPQANEIEIGLAASANRLPLLLKGPTGCGKTRFMQYLAWRLSSPLITVSCHDDLSTSDLVGRYLVKRNEAFWQDGPLTLAVLAGAICYLDEIVEARKDTTVVIHPLTDDRRELPIEKLGKLYSAPPGFMLAVSYNPGYQSVLKDLKPSTRQRFVSLSFDYPPADLERKIVIKESGIEEKMASRMLKLATMTRSLKESGLAEGASTRLIIQTARLISSGIDTVSACRAGMLESLTDDPELLAAMDEMTMDALLSHVGAIWPVSHSLGFYERKGLLGARQFMADVDRFFLGPMRGEAGVAFEEVSARMVHYISGILGRSYNFSVGPLPSTDTSTIFLPEFIDTFPGKENNIFLYKLMISLQWGHVESGVFSDMLSSDEVVQDLFSRYPDRRLSADLFSVLQFIKVFRYLEQELPGLVSQGRELCLRLIKEIIPSGGRASCRFTISSMAMCLS
ncbi:MAG: CbbQ/NirQ/NorQ/GpvN family protein [Desulfobulbaceae bacterium]|nr:CbbQ/NirQ/NorQ/GpvN family protein [Desulfobulbaceae bacterium]